MNAAQSKFLAHGFGLADMLVSLLIASLMVAMVTVRFQDTLTHSRQMHGGIADMQDALWVSAFMRDRIRNAGYLPCRGLSQLEGVDTRHGNVPLLPVTVHGQRDGFTLRSMDSPLEAASATRGDTAIRLTHTSTIAPGNAVVVADCRHAAVYTVSRLETLASKAGLLLSHPLVFSCDAPCHVGFWVEEQFYLARSPRGKETLYYRKAHPEALTTAIQALNPVRTAGHLQLSLRLADGSSQDILTRIRG